MCCCLAPTASVSVDKASAGVIEKLKAQLLQKQGDISATVQAFEEYKQVTK